MTKGTQLWPGDRMREFLRSHIRRSTQLDEADAEKLVDAFAKAINFMRVWEMPDLPQPANNAAGTSPTAKKGKAGHENSSQPPFNPYAFSAMVVLARNGKDGLMKKLAEIKTVENLKALAEAQHLAIDRNLKKADELRRAIVSATEQRLADRKAAAS